MVFHRDGSDKRMILNYNNAYTANFKISIPDCPELDFYATSTNIPTTTLNAIEIPYQDVRVKVPDNRFLWDEITIQFIMDENLYVYELIKDWQYDVRNNEKWQNGLKDIIILPLDSNKVIEYSFKMEGAWPMMIGGWQYTSGSTVSDPIVIDITFPYQHFSIERIKPIDFKIVRD